MRKVEEIQEQIRQLSAKEFAELRDWILEQDWKAWDAQIEADAKGGKLDKLCSLDEAERNPGIEKDPGLRRGAPPSGLRD